MNMHMTGVYGERAVYGIWDTVWRWTFLADSACNNYGSRTWAGIITKVSIWLDLTYE